MSDTESNLRTNRSNSPTRRAASPKYEPATPTAAQIEQANTALGRIAAARKSSRGDKKGTK